MIKSNKSLIATIVFLVILMFATTSAMMAQEVSFTPSGGVNIELAQETNQTIEVEGKSFPIHKLNGKLIIKAVSKSGKDYPVYIGQPTSKTHDGTPLRQSAKGKLIKLKLGKSGYPYCQYGN